MPGGTSGEGKTPVSAPTHTPPGGKPGANVDRGGKAKSTGTTNDLLAQMLLRLAATNQSTVESALSSKENQFDPAALLEAQNNLSEAYTAAADDPTQQSLADNGVTGGRGANYAALSQRAPTLPANITEVPSVVAAQQAYDEQLRLRRVSALGAEPAKPNATPEIATNKEVNSRTDRLSWDEYNDLSPLQKAAIDYNTMLVKAVKTDNRNREQYVDPASETYQAYTTAYEGMFPGDAVEEAEHSPETLAVLRQIGFEGDKQDDLNDFLTLDAAITAKDLRNLDNESVANIRRGGLGSQFGSPVKEERMNFLGSLATQTQDALAEKLEVGNGILDKYKMTSLALLREDDATRLGGTASAMTGMGFGNDEKDVYFQSIFNILADKAPTNGYTSDQILGAMQDELSEADRKRFVDYATKKILAAQAGESLTTAEVNEMRTPEELAQILQLQGFKGGSK